MDAFQRPSKRILFNSPLLIQPVLLLHRFSDRQYSQNRTQNSLNRRMKVLKGARNRKESLSPSTISLNSPLWTLKASSKARRIRHRSLPKLLLNPLPRKFLSPQGFNKRLSLLPNFLLSKIIRLLWRRRRRRVMVAQERVKRRSSGCDQWNQSVLLSVWISSDFTNKI